MNNVFRKLFKLLDTRERRRFGLLAILMLFVALAELFGLSSLFVLLNVLSQPEQILDDHMLASVYKALEFETLFNYQIFLSLVVFIVILIGQLIKTVGIYATTRFALWRGYSISRQLLSAYLGRSYVASISENSADINRIVLSDVDVMINFVMMPGLRLIANGMLAVGILAFLVLLDPVITLLSSLLIGGGYAAMYQAMKTQLQRLGEAEIASNTGRFRALQEAMGGFKEVKLLHLETQYLNRYGQAAESLAATKALSQFLKEAPRFLMEAIVFAALLMTVLIVLVRNNGDISAAIPMLGAFGFAVMKLLPAMQQIYYGFGAIKNGLPFLEAIHRDVTDPDMSGIHTPAQGETQAAMPLTQSLDIQCVTYSYPNHDRTALKEISLTVPAKTTIGLIGGSGAGKTTLVDLILGLLRPQAGEVVVDGVVIDDAKLRAWQCSIGYVPQAIFLADCSVAENIAFGVPADEIDQDAVERAAKLAALHEFVLSDLPEGYDTLVGERGVRLSGGQRQRIGIARALYRDPELLVLDEATSALDNLTEQAVMEAIHNIGHDKTIILIAHRLSTVADCDQIFMMGQGQVIAQGTYDELMRDSEDFRALAAGSGGAKKAG